MVSATASSLVSYLRSRRSGSIVDSVRLFRLLAGTLVPLGAVGFVLALAIGALGFATFFAVCTVLGAVVYRAAPRYSGMFDTDAPVDPTTTRTFVASLAKLALFCVAFAVVGYLWVELDLVTRGSLAVVPPTLALGLLGVLLGVFLGAGVPSLARWEVVFHRLEESFAGQAGGNALTLGTYLVVLFAAPAAAGGFVGAYVASRLLALVGWWIASRR